MCQRSAAPISAASAALAAGLALIAASGATAQTLTLQEMSGIAGAPSEATIYVAREVITMDPSKPRAEAVAVRDGRFLAVGTKAEVEAAAGKGAKVDSTFADKVVMAGFVEQHVHPVLAALTMNTKVISIEDWDAIDGFSPAVRDEKTYQDKLAQSIAAHTRTRASPSSPGVTTTTSTARCRAPCSTSSRPTSR
jgi:hypothetical protein